MAGGGTSDRQLFDKPTLWVDFDGTLHDNARPFPEIGGPVDGAVEFLYEVATRYEIWICSARAADPDQVVAIINALTGWGFSGVPYRVSNIKPPALMGLDDLVLTFRGPGSYPTLDEIEAFHAWNKPEGDSAVNWMTSAADAADELARYAADAEPYLTFMVQQEAGRAGGYLAGLQHRLKEPGRIAGKLDAEGAVTLDDAFAAVKDAVRYTAVLPEDGYTASARRLLASLAALGFATWRVRNYWGDDPADSDVVPETYRGLNVVLEARNGFLFELQIHTPASLIVQQMNWDGYRQLRQADLAPEEAEIVAARMRHEAGQIPVPPGAESLTADAAPPAALPVDARPPDPRIPADALYRPSPDPLRDCGTCGYYEFGSCRMYDGATVAPGFVCDRWEPAQAPDPVALSAAADPVPVAHHNRVLREAERRAARLEPRLAAVLQPILERVGESAAARFGQLATDHASLLRGRRGDADALGASPDPAALLASLALVAAPGVGGDSAMVCLRPRPDEAAAIADPDGEAPEQLHVTLAVLHDWDGDLAALRDALAPVAADHAPLAGKVAGYGLFEPPGCGILLPDVPGLVELRVAVTDALQDSGVAYARDHGYQAHLTVDYQPEPAEQAEMLDRAAGAPLHFDAILVVRGDEAVAELPLVGPPPLTAAAGEPPQWSAPAPDELVDVAALVAELRGKTDPVRRAAVETMMRHALESVGVDFDASNPLVAKALASTGAHISDIVATTRANVMRIIAAAYDQGLTIPDTAALIQAGMQAAAPARAVMIARTELAGAVNAGSLASTQVVSDATGTGYYKQWLTAPGAPHPRHEEYEDLDGQTQALDDYFDVGGSQLMHPADPDGDPGEVINCRCTMSYTDEAPDL